MSNPMFSLEHFYFSDLYNNPPSLLHMMAELRHKHKTLFVRAKHGVQHRRYIVGCKAVPILQIVISCFCLNLSTSPSLISVKNFYRYYLPVTYAEYCKRYVLSFFLKAKGPQITLWAFAKNLSVSIQLLKSGLSSFWCLSMATDKFRVAKPSLWAERIAFFKDFPYNRKCQGCICSNSCKQVKPLSTA